MAKAVIHKRPWPVTNEAMTGFELGHKIIQKGQEFVCLDWRPWINRFGIPSVIFVWQTTCKCGKPLIATSSAKVSNERMPTPRKCEKCHEPKALIKRQVRQKSTDAGHRETDAPGTGPVA